VSLSAWERSVLPLRGVAQMRYEILGVVAPLTAPPLSDC
jgi:hypothetical protein